MIRGKKKHIYRVGDVVRIKNPLFVKRVGYPWDKEYVKKHIITDEQRKAITELMAKFGLSWSEETNVINNIPVSWDAGFDEMCYNNILDEIAYRVLRKKGFGGKERTLHTVLKEKYQDKFAEVRAKRVIKTGTYCHGSCGSYYEPDDYDPPFLLKEKTHVLLQVEIFSDEEMWAHYNVFSPEDDDISKENSRGYEIDEVNVEPYKTQKKWEVSLWPDNQPPILLGYFFALTEDDAKKAARRSSMFGDITPMDNFVAVEDGKNTPMKEWNKK